MLILWYFWQQIKMGSFSDNTSLSLTLKHFERILKQIPQNDILPQSTQSNNILNLKIFKCNVKWVLYFVLSCLVLCKNKTKTKKCDNMDLKFHIQTHKRPFCYFVLPIRGRSGMCPYGQWLWKGPCVQRLVWMSHTPKGWTIFLQLLLFMKQSRLTWYWYLLL